MNAQDEKPVWWPELQDLWIAAGEPSMRTLAAWSGVSHTTVHSVITAERVPTFKTLARIFYALNGDPVKYRDSLTVRQPRSEGVTYATRPGWAQEQTELLTQILGALERIEAKLERPEQEKE